MKISSIARTSLIVLIGLTFHITNSGAVGINSVVIDRGEKAYTAFVSLDAEMAREAKPNVGARKDAEMIGWKKFRKSAGKYITSGIIKNEYPGSKLEKGILELLAKHPATPVGVTWNGGVAFTAFDYIQAEKSFGEYVRNPARYEGGTSGNRGPDTLDPVRQFRTLLGW